MGYCGMFAVGTQTQILFLLILVTVTILFRAATTISAFQVLHYAANIKTTLLSDAIKDFSSIIMIHFILYGIHARQLTVFV